MGATWINHFTLVDLLKQLMKQFFLCDYDSVKGSFLHLIFSRRRLSGGFAGVLPEASNGLFKPLWVLDRLETAAICGHRNNTNKQGKTIAKQCNCNRTSNQNSELRVYKKGAAESNEMSGWVGGWVGGWGE